MHLVVHGDGGSPLTFAAADQVGARRPQHSHGVHPAVLVEAFVFCRQDGFFHNGGHILNAHHGAALFAEFADQVAVGGIDPEGFLGPVVGKHVQGRQVGIGKDGNQTDNGDAENHQAEKAQERIEYPAGVIRQDGSPRGKDGAL